MRSMTFSAKVEAPEFNRAWAVGITALVHALLLAGLLVHTMGERGKHHDTDGREVVFTLTPQLPARGPAPAAATEFSAGSSVHAPRADAPGAGLAGQAQMAPAAPKPVEVAILARPDPEAVREPAPAPPAQNTAAQAETGEQAASRAASAPASAPVMVPVSQGDGGGNERKTIVVQSMGSSVGSYTFPALAGIDSRDMTELFTVETGDYPDLETAMVNHVIRQIRARYPVEIKWDSTARGRVVTLSMRIEDHEALVKFLRVELFGKRRATTY